MRKALPPGPGLVGEACSGAQLPGAIDGLPSARCCTRCRASRIRPRLPLRDLNEWRRPNASDRRRTWRRHLFCMDDQPCRVMPARSASSQSFTPCDGQDRWVSTHLRRALSSSAVNFKRPPCRPPAAASLSAPATGDEAPAVLARGIHSLAACAGAPRRGVSPGSGTSCGLPLSTEAAGLGLPLLATATARRGERIGEAAGVVAGAGAGAGAAAGAAAVATGGTREPALPAPPRGDTTKSVQGRSRPSRAQHSTKRAAMAGALPSRSRVSSAPSGSRCKTASPPGRSVRAPLPAEIICRSRCLLAHGGT